jgi:hypothetical protein
MSTSTRIQLACAWAGPVFLVIFLICWWPIAHFIPPPTPRYDTTQIAAFYNAHRTGIRVGMIGAMLATTLMFPFFAVISMRMARAENGPPALATIQFGAATLLLVFFMIPEILWIIATFRPGASGATVRTLNDIGWLMFAMVFPEYTLQLICMAIAGFTDKSPNPTWPRWAAYLNIWVGVSGAGGGIAVFFKHGPFAWNGVIGFYVPASVFVGWVLITTWLLIRSIKADAAAVGTVGTPATAGRIIAR